MATPKEALERLNKEKQYEDKIASDLLYYYLASLDHIDDLSNEEKNKVEETLKTIQKESEGHSRMFNALITYVMNNGETEY